MSTESIEPKNSVNEAKSEAGLAASGLLGTVWRHRKKGGIYRVTQIAAERGDVYLTAETKGCRSTWKAECLLPFDYEQVPNARTERQPPGEAVACNQTSQTTQDAGTGKRGGCSLQ